MDGHRHQVVCELIETEKSYVNVLCVLVDEFLAPLRKADPPILDPQELKEIFGDIEILLNYNRMFLSDLEERYSGWDRWTKLGDLVLSFTGFLKVYTQYVKHFNDSMSALNRVKATKPEFVTFCNKTFSRLGNTLTNFDLPSFLITPVQRIPRYNLLLRDIIKSTWASHIDYEDLCNAENKMKETADYVNQRVKEAESLAKIVVVQSSLGGNISLVAPGRLFVCEGELMIVKKENTKRHFFVLFSDLLLCTKVTGVNRELLPREVEERVGVVKSRRASVRGAVSDSGVLKAVCATFGVAERVKSKGEEGEKKGEKEKEKAKEGERKGEKPKTEEPPTNKNKYSSPANKSASSLWLRLKYVAEYPLDNLSVIDCEDNGKKINRLYVTSPKSGLLLEAPNPVEKQMWIKQLRDVVQKRLDHDAFVEKHRAKLASGRASAAKTLIAQQYASLRVRGAQTGKRQWATKRTFLATDGSAADSFASAEKAEQDLKELAIQEEELIEENEREAEKLKQQIEAMYGGGGVGTSGTRSYRAYKERQSGRCSGVFEKGRHSDGAGVGPHDHSQSAFANSHSDSDFDSGAVSPRSAGLGFDKRKGSFGSFTVQPIMEAPPPLCIPEIDEETGLAKTTLLVKAELEKKHMLEEQEREKQRLQAQEGNVRSWARKRYHTLNRAGVGVGDAGVGAGDAGVGVGDAGVGVGDAGVGAGDAGVGDGSGEKPKFHAPDGKRLSKKEARLSRTLMLVSPRGPVAEETVRIVKDDAREERQGRDVSAAGALRSKLNARRRPSSIRRPKNN